MDHTVVEGQVEPVLLGHLAAGPGALVGGLLGHLREQLVLEVDLGQVFEVLGHPAGLHSADFAVEGLWFQACLVTNSNSIQLTFHHQRSVWKSRKGSETDTRELLGGRGEKGISLPGCH